MFFLKKLISAFVLPPASLILLALLGLWLTARKTGWRRQLGIILASLSLVSLLALSTPAVGNWMLRSLEKYPPASSTELNEAQAIVVLGGGLYHDAPEYQANTVSHYSLERLRYAARLAKAHHLPVLVTGGAPTGGIAEAQAMRETLEQDFGVQVKWVESASRDTAENATYSAALLKENGIERIALVSHAWHLARAVPLFERQGLAVIPAPTVFTTSAADSSYDWLPGSIWASRNAAHEYLGRAADWLSQAR